MYTTILKNLGPYGLKKVNKKEIHFPEHLDAHFIASKTEQVNYRCHQFKIELPIAEMK